MIPGHHRSLPTTGAVACGPERALMPITGLWAAMTWGGRSPQSGPPIGYPERSGSQVLGPHASRMLGDRHQRQVHRYGHHRRPAVRDRTRVTPGSRPYSESATARRDHGEIVVGAPRTAE